MSNTIKLKRGSGSDPSASDLVVGEPAVRTDTGEIFLKKDDNSVAKLSGGGISDGDKGDITVSGSGTSFTIDNDVVSFAKMQNIGTPSFLGRNSSGTGNVENLSVSDVRTMLNVENGATADQTASEIVALIADQTIAPSEIDMEDNEKIKLGASDDFELFHNGDYNEIKGTNAHGIRFHTNGTERLRLTSAGVLQPGADSTYNIGTSSNRFANGYFDALNIAGNITVTGTVDGIDVAGLQAAKNSISTSNGAILNGVTATTQSAGDNSTKIATTAYTDTAISNLVDSSPSALNTLNELAAALGDDANFSTTVTNSIATKLANIVEDTTPQLGGNLDCNNKVITMNDSSGDGNNRIKLGNAGDLRIYHTGSHSEIADFGTGDLRILTSKLKVLNNPDAADELMIQATENGSVDLYHNGSKRFETSSDGLSVTGSALFADNNRIKLGGSAASPDTQLWHDGSNTYIHHSGTGDLIARIAKDDGLFRVYGNGNTSLAHFKDNAEVELFYNGSQKFETTNTGISVSGNIACSGTVDGRDLATDGSKLDGIESGATADQTKSDIDALGINAASADTVDVGGASNQNASFYVLFADNTGSAKTVKADGEFRYNPNTNTLSSTNFSGNGSSITNVNATTLDSIDSGSFLRSDASDTMSGVLTMTSTTQYMLRLSSSQNGKLLLSGSTDPYIRFQEGTTDKAYIQFSSNGNFYFVNQETGEQIYIGSGGNGLKFVHDGTTSTVWHSGNDGSGTGLDADTVDGIQGSSFLRSDAADTASGDITFSGGAGAATIAANSDISFTNGNWTGNHTKIQQHSNFLYIVGGSGGIVFREGGTNRVQVDGDGNFIPSQNNTYNLGGSSNRWANLYVNDMHFANSVENPNKVDGTWGDWTLQEGEDTVYMLNNRNGKKYKMNLTEVS